MRFHSSCLFNIGQPLLVDFDLCARTRLVFLTLVSHCWWTLTFPLPLVLSFSHWCKQCCLDADYLGLYNRQQFGFIPFCWLSRVIQPTAGWGYTFFHTASATELVGLCKQHYLDAVYLGLYNRQQVGVTSFCRLSRVIHPTTSWCCTVRVRVAARISDTYLDP